MPGSGERTRGWLSCCTGVQPSQHASVFLLRNDAPQHHPTAGPPQVTCLTVCGFDATSRWMSVNEQTQPQTTWHPVA
eukprot:364522-Chlamydomonas_euryale.AAC.8